jgi:sortase system peptidoglycan-associated protein
MKKSALSLVIISSLLLTPTMALAKEPNKLSAQHQQEIGFGAGVIIGGILGGPVGAFITGLAGSLLVKDANNKENIAVLAKTLSTQKTKSDQQIAQYQHKLQTITQNFQQELLVLEQNYQTTGRLQAENLLMSLQFSTGSSAIAPVYKAQIKTLATVLENNPELMVNLAGYTDLQGSEAQNQLLSQARVEHVKSALVNYGIDDNRIITQAYGESAPVVAKNDNEASFYDRRVVIKLHKKLDQVAKN